MILPALLLAAVTPAGTLTLDADDPVIAAEVAGRPLRLRVDLDARDVVELNPDAAGRLGLDWHDGFVAVVGREELPGRAAQAVATIDRRALPLNFSEHGRPCCAGADGVIGPGLLPYAEIRFIRRGAASAGRVRTYPFRDTEDEGLIVADGPLAVQVSLARRDTVASKAAGVLLAERYGGRWAGPYAMRAEAFGVPRPVRPLALAAPATILGLPIDRILVRSDYGGRAAMPEDRPQPGDIVVRQKGGGRAWPLVSLGRDRTGRCAAIVWRAAPPTLELDCP